MSSAHRAQAPLTKPSEELTDESDFETFLSADDLVSLCGFGSSLSGEPSLTPSEAHRRLLEIILKKGTKLQNVHRTHPLKAYPVVSIGDKDGKTFYYSEEPKPVDLDGGSYPVWNTYEEFNLDVNEVLQKKLYLFVTVESKSKFACRGSRFVGEASVAIEDLLNDFADAVDWKPGTLRVKNKKGKEHGCVTFKYKFARAHDLQPAEDPLPQSANGNMMDQMCNNNSHSILKGAVTKGAVGGVMSGLINTIGELALDSL